MSNIWSWLRERVRPSAGPDLERADATSEEVANDARRAAAELSSALHELCAGIAPGKTTQEVSDLLVANVRSRRLRPTMRGFHGYPADTNVSVNEEVLHGLPSARQLRWGDVVKVQISASSKSAFANQGWTFILGEGDETSRRLVDVGYRALLDAIRISRAGARTGDIGQTIQSALQSEGFSAIRDYVGYGMGAQPMQAPQLPCYGVAGRGSLLKAGQILNLHVIAKTGGFEVDVAADGWTVQGAPTERGALFTAMVLITADGAETLTSTDLPLTV